MRATSPAAASVPLSVAAIAPSRPIRRKSPSATFSKTNEPSARGHGSDGILAGVEHREFDRATRDRRRAVAREEMALDAPDTAEHQRHLGL